ncbi:MAG: gephyrin-like molybdotransferase Glp [Bryobacteraceae bacterium]
MATLQFSEARERVLLEVGARRVLAAPECVALQDCADRVLAEDVHADRDYPPLARSVRDGFAVRAADFPGKVRVIGEVRAGDRFHGSVRAGEAVEIMTGAPVPEGADAIVMVEHVTLDNGLMTTGREVRSGDFINPQGCESPRGSVVLRAGMRLDYAGIAMLATVGRTAVLVYPKPRVAILATGDEIVEVSGTPLEHQIRNSNSASIAAQVTRAGGIAGILPVARDTYEATRESIALGLQADLLLLSGGVSAGKYDIVEKVLTEFDAEFYFDRVLIQPGQPLVFGQAAGKFFFGLPGNPASTMITFELFARAAIELLSGAAEAPLHLMQARLTHEFRHRPGLTRFLPAQLSSDGATLTPTGWQGSGDVGAMARANAFLVAEPDRESWAAGDFMRVMAK